MAFEMPISAFYFPYLSFRRIRVTFYVWHIVISLVEAHLPQGMMSLLQRHLLTAAISEKINSTGDGCP